MASLSAEEQAELQELEELEELETLERIERREAIVRSNPAEYDPNSKEFKAKYGPTGKRKQTSYIRGIGKVEQDVDTSVEEGIGSGLVRTARGATALALPKSLEPDFASDETRSEQTEIDAPLMETRKGRVGQLLGEVAATLPLGGVTGAALKAPGAAIRPLLARTLGSAAEGALTGAILAEPGEEGSGAASGATLSSLITLLSAGGGRLVRGLVEESDAAKQLATRVDATGGEINIPLAEAASDKGALNRLIKLGYREGLPNIPGAAGQLRHQGDTAAAQFREAAFAEAAPSGFVLERTLGKVKGAGFAPEATANRMSKAFSDEISDTIHKYAFNTPANFADDVSSAVKRSIPNVDDVTLGKVAGDADQLMARYSNNSKVIDGDSLLLVKNELQRLGKRAANPREAAAYVGAANQVDDVIARELMQGGKTGNLRDLVRYKQVAGPKETFGALEKAVEAARAKSGAFSPAQLVQATPKGNRLRSLGQLANATIGQGMGRPSFVGRMATLAPLGAAAYYDPKTAGAAYVLATILASRRAQNTLMGRTAAQKMLARMLRDNPELVRILGSSVRRAAVAENSDAT